MNKNIETMRSSIISYPHGFSTRGGGVSEGIFESLNLGMTRGDSEENVRENYRRFLNSCGIETDEFVCGNQVHGNTVLTVGKEHARKPYGYDELFEADGYVTDEAGVPLVIFTADCVPLLMADEKNGVVAAVHCGWRSTVLDIEKKAVEAMERLGADRQYIRACAGPAIEMCCFEVGEEVIEAVEKLLKWKAAGLFNRKNDGKYMLDLKGVVAQRLAMLGVGVRNIDIIRDCTMCLPDKYWSHRFTGGKRGSQASVIMKTNR